MAAVYILFSQKADKHYIGSCENLESRLRKHHDKVFDQSFTALQADDWQLTWSIDDLSSEEARAIEQHIKNMKSKSYIINLKKYPEMTAKLKSRFAGGGSSR